MQAVGSVSGREKPPSVQEIAGSSENAIQPVIGYGGGECSDKINSSDHSGVNKDSGMLVVSRRCIKKRVSRII